MSLFYSPVDPAHIKKERNAAKELRRSSWWKQKLAEGLCHYCEKKHPKEELTMDHIVALARGGRSNKGNIVVSCKDCNTKKKTKTPAEILLESFT